LSNPVEPCRTPWNLAEPRGTLPNPLATLRSKEIDDAEGERDGLDV
jgi:hypothetical protein